MNLPISFAKQFRWMRRGVVWFCLALVLLLALPEDLWARRGGRISVGRSGGGFATRTYTPPASRAATWGGRAPATVTPRMGTRSATRPVSRTPARSGVDQATLNRAKTQGTVFQSRADAERAFQRDYANRFPSTFSQQPSERPNHIPQTTSVEGRNYDVTYNQRYGSYGYMQNGSWVAYNTFRDVALLSMLMRSNGYVYGESQQSQVADEFGEGAGERQSAPSRQPSSFGTGTGLAILLLMVGMGAMFPRGRGGYQPARNRAAGHGKFLSTLPATANKENRLNTDISPYSARFWRNLKVGSTIILKDEQTLQDMIDRGETITAGRDYVLEEAWRIRESRDVAEWQFLRIRSPHDEDATWLQVKSAGDQISAGVYFEADGFQPGNRRDLLDQNHFWVFNEPKNPASYQVLDLNYASHLYFNLELDGEVREVEFTKIGNQEYHGHAQADPPVKDNDRMAGTVAEYETMLPVPNPRVVFFEAGLPNGDGGLIRMLQGSEIRVSAIEVLPLA